MDHRQECGAGCAKLKATCAFRTVTNADWLALSGVLPYLQWTLVTVSRCWDEYFRHQLCALGSSEFPGQAQASPTHQ